MSCAPWQKNMRPCFSSRGIPLLCSTDAVGPLTLGIHRPLLLIPEKFSETAPESDLASALCHELAHIRRHDFLLNLAYELLYLPISFHPGAALMKARIDQTRELACDEMAAEKLSARATYARSLVSIAQSLCASVPSAGSGYALGLFDANTLENRVMNLLDKSHRMTSNLGRTFTAIASVALVVICLAISVFSVQISQAGGAGDVNPFLGTWQAQFNGEPFFTISLREKNGKLTGGCFNTSSVKLDENGELTWVDENKVQTAVLNIEVRGSTAVLTLDDANKNDPVDEFELRLVGADQAEGKFIISPSQTAVPGQKPWIFKRLPVETTSAPARLGMIVFTGPTMSIEKSELDAFKKQLQDELNTAREANGTIRSIGDVTSEIHAFWQMHGFYRATVKNIESSPISTNGSENLYALMIDLEEGPQYRVSAVQWEGANVFSPAELQTMMPIQPGDILNPSKAPEGEQALRAAYAARGYSRIAFTTQRLADDDNHTITWVFKINESGVLQGNGTTSDRLRN